MKTLLLLISLLTLTTSAFAEVQWQDGYVKRNGTYVNGSFRDTSNDGDKYNNANNLGFNNSSESYRRSSTSNQDISLQPSLINNKCRGINC